MDYSTLLAVPVLGLIVYGALWTAYTRFLHPLKHIPGPFWGSVTRLWLVRKVLKGHMDVLQRRLHEQYGPLVRIAPDEVACADPDAIRKIYPTSRPLNKTVGFYGVWHNKSFSKYPDNFANTDERLHSERRRIVHNVYSMSTVLSLEQYIDSCSALFIQRMGETADSGAVIDLGDWLQWYAFDVIGELFFGKMFGFMENSQDYGSYIAAMDTLLPVRLAAGLSSPAVRKVMLALSSFSSAARKALNATNHLTKAARGCVAARIDADKTKPDPSGASRKDLLHHLLEIARQKGGGGGLWQRRGRVRGVCCNIRATS